MEPFLPKPQSQGLPLLLSPCPRAADVSGFGKNSLAKRLRILCRRFHLSPMRVSSRAHSAAAASRPAETRLVTALARLPQYRAFCPIFKLFPHREAHPTPRPFLPTRWEQQLYSSRLRRVPAASSGAGRQRGAGAGQQRRGAGRCIPVPSRPVPPSPLALPPPVPAGAAGGAALRSVRPGSIAAAGRGSEGHGASGLGSTGNGASGLGGAQRAQARFGARRAPAQFGLTQGAQARLGHGEPRLGSGHGDPRLGSGHDAPGSVAAAFCRRGSAARRL